MWRNLFILYFVFVKKQRTIEHKKKRSKISGLESCYANRIYVLIGGELRPYGQKLVQFCKHTHTHTHARTHARTHAHTHTRARVSFSSIDSCVHISFILSLGFILTFASHGSKCLSRDCAKKRKFQKSEINIEVDGWVQVSFGIFFCWKIIPK